MAIRKALRWPANIVYEALAQNVPASLPKDASETMESILAHDSFSDKDRTLVDMIYKDFKTVTACAKELGVSTSTASARHRKVLRKLRNPSRVNRILYGDIGLAKRIDSGLRVDGPRKNECVWYEFDNNSNTWECSNCEGLWTLVSGSPFSNEMHFCPRCGAKIKAISIMGCDEEGNSVAATIPASFGIFNC